MWFTPSSTARRSTAIDWSLSPGGLLSHGILPGSRIAPNPSRLTSLSPSRHVPAAAALVASTRTGYRSHVNQETPM